MDLGVTIDAPTCEQVRTGVAAARQALWCIDDGGVARALVTRLAEERRAQFQERGLGRAVRIVTVGAVLRHGLVLPQKRAAKLRVAGRASFRDGVLDELCGRARAVRRVARRARHGPFAQRMIRGLVEIRVLRLMARGTGLDLRNGDPHRILRRVQCMTACASDIAGRVGAGCPIVGSVRLMTSKAWGVLPRRRRERLPAEVDHAGERSAARRHVCATRSVAGLALQAAVAERAPRIIRTRMLGAEQACHAGIVVTAEAGVRALRAVGRDGVRRTFGGQRMRDAA